jgi:D-alanine-D-alanine ligase
MDIPSIPTNLPILILYNANPAWPQEDYEESKRIAQVISAALRMEGLSVTDACLETQDLNGLLQPHSPDQVVVFNLCEEIPGIPHSYDLIAGTLEEQGFTFTGADSQAMAFSQDKQQVKERLDACGIATPCWKIYTSTSPDGWKKFPAIVKSSKEHASIGITRESIVWSKAELASRVEYVLDTYKAPVLVEEFIDGREFHVTVLGNDSLFTLPAAEMDFSAFEDARDRLCTYESKFEPQSEAYKLIKSRMPASLTKEEEVTLAKIAMGTYRATDCRDYARLDIRLRDGTFYVLDINHNADISPDTSPVLAAEQVGWSYGKFCSLIIGLASRRHPVFGPAVEEKTFFETGALSPVEET